jgi:poly(A) polymerase
MESHSKWIQIDKPFYLPGYVRDVIDRLDEAGHIAYVVGGGVRDFLLGIKTKDHDIATSADPDEICRLFPDAITVGKSYGVLKIPVRTAELAESTLIEIATFRKDLEYRDHRHPSGVLFSGPEEDAHRRDFTVNALFFDLKTSRILDTVGGMEDLEAKRIRAIGDPHQRFKEDALRLLRAIRFAARFGFQIDEHTIEAIQQRSRLITRVSAERIRDELTLMWRGPRPGYAFGQLSKLGLLIHVLPEAEALKGVQQSPRMHPEGDAWDHTFKVMESLAKQNPIRSTTLSWGALLHDIGKPAASKRSGGKNFNGHENDGVAIALKICERLKLSRNEIETIAALVEDHLKFKDVFQMREATLQRFIREPHFEELLALHKADAIASDGNLAYYEFCASLFEELKNKPQVPLVRLITGEDLIQLGLSPGPRFSEILRTIEDLTLEQKLKTKEQALEYVIKHFVE